MSAELRSLIEGAHALPLRPRKRTNSGRLKMSPWCQLRLNALQRNASLFDHLVCEREQPVRQVETKRFRGREIENELELG